MTENVTGGLLNGPTHEPATIIKQIIDPEHGGFSPELAKYVLSLSFSERLQVRCSELSEKAQEGTLSDDERAELDEFLSANAFLIALKSKARISLKRYI